ncbi:hypothetical protein B0I37DRAFT_350935 [Chaetomium sp. MPI-CAGE-AT-0009]|nr:hypothetical protein B0I37DRAFT_350935 [Chaetomium sp. MPI-CAGE-AT-0009]
MERGTDLQEGFIALERGTSPPSSSFPDRSTNRSIESTRLCIPVLIVGTGPVIFGCFRVLFHRRSQAEVAEINAQMQVEVAKINAEMQVKVASIHAQAHIESARIRATAGMTLP